MKHIENQCLEEYIGKTKTKNLVNEIHDHLFELKKKEFPDSKNPVQAGAIVSAIKDQEIKSIGMSCLNDLLLDNFCEFWIGAFGRTGTARDLVTTGGATEQFVFRSSVAFSAVYNHNQNVSIGSLFQVGQGTTPASRDDFAIETPFPSAPESNLKVTGIGVYTVGLSRVNVAGTISPTTDGGSISEFVMYAQWQKFPNQAQTRHVALSRDNISPVVNFTPLDTINIDWAIQL